jgi:hypothetical protein
MLVRLGAVVLILAAVFGALGCGTNLDTYNRTMDAWTDDLNAMPAFPQVQHDQQGLPYFDDSESGARLQASTGALAELEKIKPPRQIAQEHQRLVEAYRVWFQLERQFVAAAAVHDSRRRNALSSL